MKQLIAIFLFLFLAGPIFGQSVPKWKITELEKYVRESKKPLIVNFWATYCQPCVEEIPYFQQLVKQYKKEGVELMLVSLDLKDFYPSKIQKFAEKKKFTTPIVWLNETNADYFCPRVDSTWSGAIPASLFINNKTGYRKFFEEQIPKEKLEKEIISLVGAKK